MVYKPEELRVIIPVGGLAKRLMPLTAETSKALIRLVNMPLIEIAMLGLAKQGVKHFIFGVKGYRNFRDLFDYFQEGYGFSAKYNIYPRVHIKYQPNIEDYGSADSVRINLEYYDVNDPMFAVQGDNIFDLDLKQLLEFHEEKGGIATICLKEVSDIEGYGIVDIDENMQIKKFIEKPEKSIALSNLVNTGLYLFNPEIRKILQSEWIHKTITHQKRLDFGYDFIPYLIQSGYEVYGYIIKKGWYDVGTPERYLNAMYDILNGRLECLKEFDERIFSNKRIWIQGKSPESIARKNKIIEMVKKGKIELEEPVLIGRHCKIEEGVKISNSCIDNYTKIEKGAFITDSAIMDRVCIGEYAEINKSIIGRHTTIMSNSYKQTRVTSISVIADDVYIYPGCNIRSAKVYPHLKLNEGIYEGNVLSSK
ncbi:MAG: NDP-sugar synthase [Candidatus Bathyarchaeia archaeon]